MAEFRYTTGGTVQAQEGGLYLQRPADEQLLELCRQSRFAYVLTPRQLGKSSLMIRTAEQLLAEGFRAVLVDLTQIGTGSDAEKWYGDVLEVVADQLELATSARAWWKQEEETGLTLRLTCFFEEVVLAEVSEPIVIFVDEIDTTLSLAFTDDFFAAIRYFYVARAKNPALRRLSFVLIGVATPADLIRDPRRTPFNIGERVDLRDFTAAEAAPLAEGLPLPTPEAERALGWILGWTGGHPYLSQRLCSVLAEEPPATWSEAAVDRAVNRTFFGERSEQDNNLQFVRDMLTKRAPEAFRAELLRTYRIIWQGKQPVADEEQNLVHAHLKLAGVVRRNGRQLVVRNRLYQEVFNAAWIAELNPEEFWKRYGPVLKWAVPVSVSAVLVAGVMTALALEARRQAAVAMLREQTTRAVFLLSTTEAVSGMVLAIDAWVQSQAFPDVQAGSASALLEALRTVRETNRLPLKPSTVTPLAFSKDGKWIAIGDSSGLGLWNAKTGEQTQAYSIYDDILGVGFDLDHHVAQGAGTFGLWSLSFKGEKMFQRPYVEGVDAGAFPSASFSLDGRMIAIGSRDGLIQLAETRRGDTRGSLLKGHQGGITSLAFSPDSNLLASADVSGTLRLWNVQRSSPIRSPIKVGDSRILSLAFSPDGNFVAIGGYPKFTSRENLETLQSLGSLQVWDIRGGRLHTRVQNGLSSTVNSVTFSPDGRILLSAGEDQLIRLWHIKHGEFSGLPLKGHEAPVNSVALSPDGRLIASASKDETVRLWATENDFFTALYTGGVSALSFSPDSSTIAIANGESIYFLDSNAGTRKSPVRKIHDGNITALKFSTDGRLLATGGVDETVRILDVKTNAVVRTINIGSGMVRSLAFDLDSRFLFIGSDGPVRMWDIKKGTLSALRRFGKLPTGGFGGLFDISSDGQAMASASGSQIHVGNAMTDKLISAPIDQRGYITAMKLSPDGNLIAVGIGNWIILRNAKTGKPIGLPLKGHEREVTSIDFSPDGRMIASSSEDKTVRLWDVKSGAAIGSPLIGMANDLIGRFPFPMLDYQGDIGGVRDVAFSRDGKRLVIGGWQGAYLIPGSPEEWLRLACARMRYHPLVRDPASVTTDKEQIAAGKRAAQACQSASNSAEQAQHQDLGQAFAGLLIWARGLLGG